MHLIAVQCDIVSIRALTRRATRRHLQLREGREGFNSCPHAEGNMTVCCSAECSKSFNSCPHAEGNGKVEQRRKGVAGFNSCPHAEGNTSRLFCVL